MTTLPPPLSVASKPQGTEKHILELLEDSKAIATLPSMKSVLGELETLTQKGNIQLDEVAKLVELDQSLSLLVLRMANSAFYAPRKPIMDVPDAILYIGLGGFRMAVMSMRCIEQTCHIKQSSLEWKDFWIHAAGVGHLTRELAAHLNQRELEPESYYLMGLLHDIGKVVLAQLKPGEFDQIYLQAALEKKAPSQMETEILGADHGEIGGRYLEKQSIPLALRDPIRFHHASVLPESHFKNALLIRLADRLTLHFNLGQSGNHADLSDPFLSDEWNWYLENSRHADAAGTAIQETVLEKVSRVTDLVRNIIT
jgi:HD-like signal output (HDOD) protein